MSDYVKLSEKPQLVYNNPSCGTCLVDLVDEDGWLCPSCGTSWGYNDSDGDEGTLYEEWSGEELDAPAVPDGAEIWNDPQLEARRAELRRADNIRFWGCGHGFLCSNKCKTEGAKP